MAKVAYTGRWRLRSDELDRRVPLPRVMVTVHLTRRLWSGPTTCDEDENLSEARTSSSRWRDRAGNSGLNEISSGRRRDRQEIKAKRAERKELLEKAKGSALKLVLRKPSVSGEDEDEGNVFDKLRKVLAERYPEHAAALNNMADQKGLQELFFANPHLAHEQNVLMYLSMVVGDQRQGADHRARPQAHRSGSVQPDQASGRQRQCSCTEQHEPGLGRVGAAGGADRRGVSSLTFSRAHTTREP